MNSTHNATKTNTDHAAERSDRTVPAGEARRPYQGPRLQTRDSEALRGVLSGVSAATGFVQP